ncbi:reverse transcriptase-like protein [Candidatus Gracilibacteria bacterium]|nr:reverse transcriptase-like protein [Candidatus Gracilibacteria bacterium]
MKLSVYTDGGSRGNPGPAGIGVYIVDENHMEIEKRYKYLGEKTNNEAEYTGALLGIKRAVELGGTEIDLYMDSKLVIEQLSGKWKIKKAELQMIHKDIAECIANSGIKIVYHWIPREKNKEADRLSNVAMDKQQ